MAKVRRLGMSFRDLKSRLRELPLSVAHEAAPKIAADLGRKARVAFDSGQTVYGDPRPSGVGGRSLSLVRSGLARRVFGFVANGTIVRSALGPSYTKYLIGKYRILPVGNAAIPVAWQRAIRSIFGETLAASGSERRAA
jgi:hypothetical protein